MGTVPNENLVKMRENHNHKLKRLVLMNAVHIHIYAIAYTMGQRECTVRIVKHTRNSKCKWP